jgi:hypothetical protein
MKRIIARKHRSCTIPALLGALLLMVAPRNAAAQGYEIWYHDLPSQAFKVLDASGQPDRTIPFPFARDAQFIVAPTRDKVYFVWGTNGGVQRRECWADIPGVE